MAALGFASLWLWQARQMDIVGTAMLTHQREPVPGKYPSLDALILSQVDQQQPGKTFRPSSQVRAIADHLLASLDLKSLAVLDLNNLTLRTVANQPANRVPSVADQCVVDDDPSAALFIPAFMLPLTPDQRGIFRNSEEVRKAIQGNQQLVADVRASKAVSKLLPSFASQPLFDGANEYIVTQAYYITETGVTRMWQLNSTSNATRDNFNPHRVFQDRPYFWPSLEHIQKDTSEFSYVSRPYFDVAGNGVVTTACWGYQGQNGISDSVLCLDSERDVSLAGLLSDYVVGNPEIFKCYNKSDGTHSCPLSFSDAFKDVKIALQEAVAELDRVHRFDDMQGGLYVVAAQPTPLLRWIDSLQFNGSDALKHLFSQELNTTFYFTAPSPRSGEADSSVTEFRLYRVDLSRPHEELMVWALLTFVFGFLAAISFYVLHRSRVYALQFMHEVETVMAISPVAFCHLDESDRISSHNQAFRDLLGYREADVRHKKLRSLLARGDSQLRYDIITKYRRRMLFTPAYEVCMMRGDDAEIRVVISGSPLYMYPRTEKHLSQNPHTFGIILKPSEAKTIDYVPFETRDFEQAVKSWSVIPATVPGI